MGLFDGIKMMADLVKAGVSAAKASGKLDELTERSQEEFKSLLKPGQAKLYQDYKALADAKEKESDIDKQNAMTEKVEAAEVAYLAALEADASFPKAFRAEIVLALEEFRKANDMPAEIFEKHMMSQAKTDEEKEAVRQIMRETLADEADKQ